MNIFKLVPKDGVKVTKRLAAEIKLAEATMNRSFEIAKRKKRIYDIVCAVGLGNMTDEQALEEIRLLNIDD